MSKEDFIKFLTNASKEEVNSFIKNNGKPPKPVKLVIFLKG